MMGPRSDALVFFGITGDLAYKKIFPALHAMARRGHLDVPVVGVARSGWTLERLKERIHASIAEHGGVDETAFARLANRDARLVRAERTGLRHDEVVARIRRVRWVALDEHAA